jgi:predicted flap endonuclease-1-like 5' DNA nuclease
MKRSDTSQRAGFTEAEALESTVAERMRRQQADDLRDLVCIGDFLAPEAHRQGGVDEAASAVREWADDDVAMIAAAENIARRQHQDDSAEILHRARVLAAV